MTDRILFVVGALLFLSLIEAVYAADLASHLALWTKCGLGS